MALSLQKFREMVFQLVFSSDFSCLDEEEEKIEFMMKQLLVTKKSVREALEKERKVWSQKEKIDELIKASSHAYDFERISPVEKSILRLAVYELCCEESTPPKVVLSEAIRLTRKFATAESAGFVNAVLDAIYQAQIQDECSTSALLHS